MSGINALKEAIEAFEFHGLKEDPQAVAILATGIMLAEAHSSAIRHLGLADAATPMGAIEALSMEVKDVARALGDIAQAIGEIEARCQSNPSPGTIQK